MLHSGEFLKRVFIVYFQRSKYERNQMSDKNKLAQQGPTGVPGAPQGPPGSPGGSTRDLPGRPRAPLDLAESWQKTCSVNMTRFCQLSASPGPHCEPPLGARGGACCPWVPFGAPLRTPGGPGRRRAAFPELSISTYYYTARSGITEGCRPYSAKHIS